MTIEICEKEKEVYLATENGWKKQCGHTLKIGDHLFSAVMTADNFGPLVIFSELTTGTRLTIARMNEDHIDETESKEGYIQFLYTSALNILEVVERLLTKESIENRFKSVVDKLGPKPRTKELDFWLNEEEMR